MHGSAVARGFAHAAAPAGIGDQGIDRVRQLLRIARRYGNRLEPIARDTGNGGVERGVDNGPARGHRLELDQAKGFRIGHRRHDEDVGDPHQFCQLAVGNAAEQADATVEPEFADQLLQMRPLAALADDPDLEILSLRRAQQHVKALLGDEPPAGEHEASAFVDGRAACLRPIIFRNVDPERHGMAFAGEFPEQRRRADENRV